MAEVDYVIPDDGKLIPIEVKIRERREIKVIAFIYG